LNSHAIRVGEGAGMRPPADIERRINAGQIRVVKKRDAEGYPLLNAKGQGVYGFLYQSISLGEAYEIVRLPDTKRKGKTLACGEFRVLPLSASVRRQQATIKEGGEGYDELAIAVGSYGRRSMRSTKPSQFSAIATQAQNSASPTPSISSSDTVGAAAVAAQLSTLTALMQGEIAARKEMEDRLEQRLAQLTEKVSALSAGRPSDDSFKHGGPLMV